MKKCDCTLCKFENPKVSTAAIIIKDQKLLVAKRLEEPFKGMWDFFGGYLTKGETPGVAHRREIKEELGVDSETTFLGSFPGTASYKEYEFPVINFAYLTELKGEPKLNTKENSEYKWVPISELKEVAFDSNMKILKFVKEKFTYDLGKVKDLIAQLDPSAVFNEQSLYKAMFNGYVSKVEEGGKLLGMGWIFPRQTLLRRQAVVEDMIVDESQRGKGLGEKILLDLIGWCRKEGMEVVELTTNPKRIAANSLYQKVGFKLHPTNHYLLNL
jgi:ADP-ribose pyrophosphatase YjhB (NUDIX family)/GNAT superfamily N-acetyltransferase